MQPYGDNFIPVIPTDSLVHTPDNPTCSDPDCPCQEGIKAELLGYYNEGIITADDATRILERGQLWQ